MTRPIKFRGKRLDTGHYIYGSLVQNPYETAISDWDDVTYCRYEVDPETVGQFTGKFDDHGNEVYEGDLLKTLTGQKKITFVTWNEDSARFNGIPLTHQFEVIGNTTDTPDLGKEAV